MIMSLVMLSAIGKVLVFLFNNNIQLKLATKSFWFLSLDCVLDFEFIDRLIS